VEPVEPEPVDPVEPAPVDEPVEPEPELEPAPMLEPPPMRAFFSTKPPPLPPDADADSPAALELLELLDELLLEPSARCRQPVAVTEPAVSDDERPVPWPLCGVLDVGDCAASVPHRAMLLLSVIAHCQ
jgi:hypothetical protein